MYLLAGDRRVKKAVEYKNKEKKYEERLNRTIQISTNIVGLKIMLCVGFYSQYACFRFKFDA